MSDFINVAGPVKVKPKLRGVSHQIAFFAALAAGGVLVFVASTPRAMWAGLVYALSLAGMFGISAAYHRPTWSVAARARMRRLDHAGIFLLIAGSYTPVCVLTDNFTLLAIAWAGAALGLLHAAFVHQALRRLNAVIYVVLGCAALPVLPSLLAVLGPAHVALLLAGGAVYILGAVVYALRWPDPAPAVFGHHEIFHLMVIIASVLHFAVMLGLVRGDGRS